MKARRRTHLNLLHPAILLLTLGCILPGLSAPGAAPAGDPAMFSTIVAGTGAALATQTAQAAPPEATPTPLPTETPTPLPTETPREIISTEGTSLRKQADGSYLFSDHQGGYQLAVPIGWLVVRVNEQETMNAWALPEASHPSAQRFLTQVQGSDPKLSRLFGLDILPEHLERDFATNFNVLLDRTSTESLETMMDGFEKQVSKTFISTKIIRADLGQTSSQIPTGILEITSDMQGTSGESINLYQKQALFRVKGGALFITFSTTADLKDLLLPVFDGMIDRIKMLEQ